MKGRKPNATAETFDLIRRIDALAGVRPDLLAVLMPMTNVVLASRAAVAAFASAGEHDVVAAILERVATIRRDLSDLEASSSWAIGG